MDNLEVKCWLCSENSEDPQLFAVGQFELHNQTEHRDCHVHCKMCPNIFKTRSDLHEHFFEEHSKREFVCLQCIEAGEDESLLPEIEFPQHYKDHHEEYTVACYHCPNKFTSENLRDKHMRLWHNDPPVRPKVFCANCDKSFSTKKDVKDHTESIHHKCKFFCRNCSNGYESKRLMTDHAAHCRVRYG